MSIGLSGLLMEDILRPCSASQAATATDQLVGGQGTPLEQLRAVPIACNGAEIGYDLFVGIDRQADGTYQDSIQLFKAADTKFLEINVLDDETYITYELKKRPGETFYLSRDAILRRVRDAVNIKNDAKKPK